MGLSLALSILCAFSSMLCNIAHSVPIYTDSALYSNTYLAETNWASVNKAANITFLTSVDHPVAQAMLLAHETQNITDGYSKECGVWEFRGYDQERKLYFWFSNTFGVPVLEGTNYLVLQSALLPNLHQC